MKNVVILHLIGPPGSGKTHLAYHTMKQGLLGKVLYIFNDDGTENTVDGNILKEFADFKAQTSGCFGCSDSVSLKDAIRAGVESKQYDSIVIEPLGFIPGHEVPNILKEMHLPLSVICLLDVECIDENEVLNVVPSQLQAATHGIGLTHLPGGVNSIDDPKLDKALDYIAKHTTGKKDVFLVCKGDGIPETVISTMLNIEKLPNLENFHHHHHHHHDHAYTYSFLLKNGVTYKNLKEYFSAHSIGIIRVKGVIEGKQFHMRHGNWEVGYEDTSPNFVTFYSTKNIEISFFSEIVNEDDTKLIEVSAKKLLRSENVPIEQTIAYLEKLLDESPIRPLISVNGPVTHPEFLEIINEIRKRPGVPQELFDRCIQGRVSYFLKTSELLENSVDWWKNSNKKRGLSIGICWFAENKPDSLTSEIMNNILNSNVANMFIEGFSAFTKNDKHSDEGKAKTIYSEALDTKNFLERNFPEKTQEIREAWNVFSLCYK